MNYNTDGYTVLSGLAGDTHIKIKRQSLAREKSKGRSESDPKVSNGVKTPKKSSDEKLTKDSREGRKKEGKMARFMKEQTTGEYLNEFLYAHREILRFVFFSCVTSLFFFIIKRDTCINFSCAISRLRPDFFPAAKVFLFLEYDTYLFFFRYNYNFEHVPTLGITHQQVQFLPSFTELVGPTKMTEGILLAHELVCAETVSGYPKKTKGAILCDCFHVRTVGDRVIFALADGCNWGDRPRAAAEKASRVRHY